MTKHGLGTLLIVAVSVLAIAGVASFDPIAQDVAYHGFEDQRTLLGVPNFWNVVSNIPFLLVGLLGLWGIYFKASIKIASELKPVYAVFFTGVALVAVGSGYYHLAPSNATLAWDRLPMTIAFMALFAIIIGEYGSAKWAKLLFAPFLAIGVLSVAYWQASELQGQGDLRPYILVQFLPMLVIPIILLCFRPRFTHGSGYWMLLGAYILAKVFEHFDEETYAVQGFISGHSLKHIVAALGILLLLRAYRIRGFNKHDDVEIRQPVST